MSNWIKIWGAQITLSIAAHKTVRHPKAPETEVVDTSRAQKRPGLNRTRAISPQRRTTLRYIAHAIGVPASTLKGYYKRGLMVKAKWAMDFVRPDSNFQFADMYDFSRMYLLPGEDPSHRSAQSKRFIKKVMFLSAVARPKWDDDKAECWNSAQSAPVYKNMLIEHVIPGIKAKWPVNSTRCVVIQQDNARPHVPSCDQTVLEACTSNEIVAATNQAWHDVDPWSLERNFLTLHCCFREVIMCAGDNSYKVPHMGKAALKRSGLLPETVASGCEVFDAGCALMSQHALEKVMHDLAVETAAELEMIDIISAFRSMTRTSK
ncbi:hypothetical protein H310_14675 [Aphanomyces invadans]|uniref:Uncharacterized protein n=1 Tax=Aphanomyces invadans TaxID=157072 RepID=A0A024T969_9STRA|nr:hypothetical protein H310_14675 [Aphanomyces invadans]ETV90583.1 hypothetical protein H310_14675 [Aphanomyces invadans]|eukprot:XP_008880797.1 hypothetical protein H310_14675 [Aphanomyces invadans]